jgi:hypothetical protein
VRARRVVALILGLAAGSLLIAGVALGRAPVIKSVKVSNHVATYTWTLPPGVETRLVETSVTPGTNVFGYFSPASNQYSFNVPPVTATSVVDDRQFPAGTYFVHIGGEDTTIIPCPQREFSNTMLFVVNSGGDGSGADVANGTPECTGEGGSGGTDKTRPSALIKFSRRQDVDKLFVRARMDEAGTLTANATVKVGGSSKVLRFTPVAKAVSADKLSKLRLKLKKSKLRQVKRALHRGKRLKAKVSVVGRDRAGNTVTKTATIRLTD